MFLRLCSNPNFSKMSVELLQNSAVILFFYSQCIAKFWSEFWLSFFAEQSNYLIFHTFLKSSFSKKVTKIWINLPLVLTLLSKKNCFVKTGGRFFQILWPPHNFWTLKSRKILYFVSSWTWKCSIWLHNFRTFQ